MPFRIVVRSDGKGCVLEIHGWLRAPEIEVFEQTCAAHEPPFQIELAQLVNVDAAGLSALQRQQYRGVRLSGASPYIALLMSRTLDTDSGRN